MDDKIRVNRVAVQVNGDIAVISLYKNNIRLAEFTNIEIGVPDYYNSKIPNKTMYQTYCRNVTINLLQNNGINGYYYDEKKIPEVSDGVQTYCKYSIPLFHGKSVKMVDKLMQKSFDDTDIVYEILDDATVDISKITEKYKDGNIKYGTMTINVALNKQYKIGVVCAIKSGQICKPKVIIFGGKEQPLNTNLLCKIARGREIIT